MCVDNFYREMMSHAISTKVAAEKNTIVKNFIKILIANVLWSSGRLTESEIIFFADNCLINDTKLRTVRTSKLYNDRFFSNKNITNELSERTAIREFLYV